MVGEEWSSGEEQTLQTPYQSIQLKFILVNGAKMKTFGQELGTSKSCTIYVPITQFEIQYVMKS